VLLGLFALAVYHYRHHLNLASGRWSDRDFRTFMERSAVVTDFVNERLPFGDVPMGAGPVKILNAEEIHRFYFEKQVVREGLFGLETRYWETLKTPAEVVAFLKARGFTHVLLAHPAGRMGTWPPLSVRTLVRDPESSALYFEKVFEARSKNQAGQVYDYALYRIK